MNARHSLICLTVTLMLATLPAFTAEPIHVLVANDDGIVDAQLTEGVGNQRGLYPRVRLVAAGSDAVTVTGPVDCDDPVTVIQPVSD